MNAVTAQDEQLTASGNGAGNRSDSDTDLEQDSSEYYQPISNGHHESDSSDDDESLHHHQLPNGHVPMENDLTDDEEEEEEEEERLQETEMERALREDARRRNAPLPQETADRVMQAMRGIRFGGPPPQWAGRVSEDELIYRVRERARMGNRRNP